MTQWGLDVLFNPAKRHMDEEKQRLQSTREEVGDSSGGRRIDLESGRVVIQRQSADDADAEVADEADDADGTGNPTAIEDAAEGAELADAAEGSEAAEPLRAAADDGVDNDSGE